MMTHQGRIAFRLPCSCWLHTITQRLQLTLSEVNTVQTLKLDIYSDVICPWCYIGKRRLESAIERLPSEVRLDIKWRAFELNPNMPPEGVERREYRVAKFGSWERSQELDQQVAAAGAEVGISFNFAAMERTPNTF